MTLHDFKQLTNYSFEATYNFIVSGLVLLPSLIAGPVTVEIPERGKQRVDYFCYAHLKDDSRFPIPGLE